MRRRQRRRRCRTSESCCRRPSATSRSPFTQPLRPSRRRWVAAAPGCCAPLLRLLLPFAPRAVPLLAPGGGCSHTHNQRARRRPSPLPSASQHIFKLFSLGGYITNHIFRVDKGFVAQTADVASGRRHRMSAALAAIAKANVPLEVDPHVKHLPGVLSMARHDDPNSGGSSFSLLLGRAPHLDMQYAIFGCVTAGMKTLRAMEGVETTTSGIFVMPKARAARAGSGASAQTRARWPVLRGNVRIWLTLKSTPLQKNCCTAGAHRDHRDVHLFDLATAAATRGAGVECGGSTGRGRRRCRVRAAAAAFGGQGGGAAANTAALPSRLSGGVRCKVCSLCVDGAGAQRRRRSKPPKLARALRPPALAQPAGTRAGPVQCIDRLPANRGVHGRETRERELNTSALDARRRQPLRRPAPQPQP